MPQILLSHRCKLTFRLAGFFALSMWMAGAAAPAQAGYAYITSSTGNTLSIVDTATNAIVAQRDMGGTSMGAITLPNGNFAYVAVSGANQVKVLDTTTNAVVATIAVESNPRGLAALPDSSQIYVTNQLANTISVIDTATNTVTATIPVASMPVAVVTSPDGSRIYAVAMVGESVQVINTATNTVTNTIPLSQGGMPLSPLDIDITPDGTKLFVASGSGSELIVIDTASLTIPNRYTIPGPVQGVAASADGSRAYLTSRNANEVQVVDPSTGTISASISVGGSPNGVAMNAGRTRAYVANESGYSVSVIDLATNGVVATIGGLEAPFMAGRFVSPELSRLTVDANGGRVTATTAAGPRLTCSGMNSCPRNYATSATVTLTAVPADDNSLFVNWGGDCSGQSASITVAMATARNCTANYIFLPPPPPVPPSWFNPGALPPVFNVPVSPAGAFVASFGSIFTTTLTALTATVPDALKPLFTFVADAVNKTLTGVLGSLPGLPVQPIAAPDTGRAASNPTPNPIYPAMATIAAPVTVTATDTQGTSYGVTFNMTFQAPRPAAAMAALSLTVDNRAVGNGASARPALSHDGGQIVFQSAASNLVPAAQSAGTDILRYRALSGGLDRLSQSAFATGGPSGGALGPAIDPGLSNDGQYAAFAASGQGLVLGLDANGMRQIYRIALKYPRVDRDPATPTAELVSGTASGLAGNAHSDSPVLSGDGRYAVFASRATNLGPGLDGTSRIWRKDMQTGALTLVSPPGDATDPAVTANGSFVAFAAGGQVHLKDLGNGALWTVAQGTRPRLSAGGDAIVFVSAGSIVVVRGGTTTTVGQGDQPSVSADGRFVAWRATDGQIQVRDTMRGVSALVSRTASGTAGNGASSDPAISGDGRSIAFATNATDLVTGTVAAGQVMLAGNPLVDPAGTRYWYVTTGDQQSLAIERQGSRAYVASLTYDTSGNSTWVAGFCNFSGLTCAGNGFAITFAENGTDAALTFGQATLGLKAFPLGGNTMPAMPGLPEAGWWYNTDDPSGATGWFLATATPSANGVLGTPVAMLTGALYDAAGKPFWAVAQGSISGSTSFSFGATLNRYAGGAPLGQTATRSPSGSALGPIAVTWSGQRTATAVLPNGQRVNLARWPF